MLVAAMVLGLVLGPVRLETTAVLREVAGRLSGVALPSGLSEREAAIVWELRMPRVVLGGLVGSMLAAAGGAYQGVFRNPLADPYLLGVAAGAGMGATVGIAYGGALDWPVDAIPLAAFLGAVVAVAATYVLGRSAGRGRTGPSLILAGVAVASFFTALQTFIQQREADSVREVFAWILGRLGTVGWQEVRLALPYVAVSALVLLLHRRLLDVLGVGDEEAATLGLPTSRVRLVVVLAATLGTAAAVAVSGLIGFVGIIVPHAIRLTTGWSYRTILPLSLVLGGAFLIAADLLARLVMAPAEVPIGVVTAFFGAPFFGLVLRTTRRRAL
ncbi:MAG: iron ABC transporter permease [Actinomycetota bacterium]|nr:iron ABC transporter permease [Actinomycetota bacterium]